MDQKKSKVFNILLIITATFIFLLLAEACVRMVNYVKMSTSVLNIREDSAVSYEHKPYVFFTGKNGIKISYNSLGFIGEEVGVKPEGVFRILGIGDSITEGAYLPQGQRYINRISGILEAKGMSRIEIINAGIGGYNTFQELELIKSKCLALNPDLIIVGVCLNDYVAARPRLRKTWFNRIMENYRDGSRARHLDFLYQRSDFYKFIYDALSGLRRNIYTDKGYRAYVRGYKLMISDAQMAEWKDAFADMMRVARENNLEILFVIFPLESQVINNEDSSCAVLNDFFRQAGAYHIDLIRYFKRYSGQGESLFAKRDIVHPTALGHTITADVVSGYILDNKIAEGIAAKKEREQ